VTQRGPGGPTDPLAEVPDTDVLDTAEAGPRVIRGGILRSVAYVAGLLLSLAAVPFMIRHLGAADYGRFATVSAVIFIVSGLTEAGLTSIGVREYTLLESGERKRLIEVLCGLRIVVTLVTVAAAAAIMAVAGADPVVVAGIGVAGLGLLLTVLQQTYAIPLSVSLRLGWLSALEMVKQLALVAGILALVIMGASLFPFFWTLVVSSGLALVATLVLVRSEVRLVPAFALQDCRRLLQDALPYAAATAVGVIYFREALVLTSFLASEDETGYFSAAFRIVEVLTILPWLIVTTAFPILARAARDDRERLAYSIQRLFDAGVTLGAFLTVITAMGAKVAIDVIAGADFGPSVEVLRLQALSLIPSFLVATWAFALLSLRRHRSLLIANALAVVVATVGTFALVPPLGANGAAIATVAAEAALAATYLVFLVRSASDLRPGLALAWRSLTAAAIAGFAGVMVPVSDVAATVVAAGVFAAALAALGGIPWDVVDALRRRGTLAEEG
jgi:O-antigen/teichoic acid export membrane protein